MGSAMRYQPQGRATIFRSGLTKGLVFSTVDPLAPLSASGHAQTQQGSGFVRNVTKDGRTVAAGADQTTTGVIVLPASVRDALVGKPVTIAWVTDGARASGAAQAIYCHRDGSTQAFYIGVNTANVQFAVLGFSDVNLNPGNLATATRFVLTADGTTVTLYTDSQITTAAGAGLPASTTILPAILNRQTGGRGNSSNVANISVWNRALTPSEAAQWQANPWQIFDTGSSSSAYLAAVATSAAGTGSTPTTISATKAASTINGGAAQVALPSTIAANQASESTAGLAAGITLPTTISASTATVADTGLAASISLPTSISASAATATDSGLTASVSTGSSISASQASETASGLAAGVVLPTVVSASQATASDSGLTASITTGAGIQASTATETETGLSASVSLPTVIGATKATATDTGLAATVTSGAGIQASTANEASAGQQAQITLPTVVAATEGSVTINCQPATVSIGESIKGSTGTGSDIGYPAQVSSTTGISASVATETSAVLAADINTYVPPLPINPLRLYVGEARARKLYGGKDDVQNLTEMIVGDVETFSYSFKKTLPSGATITGAVPHIVVHAGIDPNPQAMVVGLPTINGAIVSIELKALVPGVSYWPRMTATYSDRQQVTLPDPGKGSLSVVA